MKVKQIKAWPVELDSGSPLVKALAAHAAAVAVTEDAEAGTVTVIIKADSRKQFDAIIAEAEAKADKPDHAATVDKLVAELRGFEERVDAVFMDVHKVASTLVELCRSTVAGNGNDNDTNATVLFTEAGVHMRYALERLTMTLTPLRSARFRLEEWKEENTDED